MSPNATRLGLAEHQSKETYTPQSVLSGRAAKRCLALAGVTVAAMIPLTESTSKAQAQSANTYTCPGAKVAYKDQPQPQFDAAVECVVNAERAERGLNILPHSDVLALASLWHSQDMTNRGYFSDIAPEPTPHGPTQGDRIQAASQKLTGGPLTAPDTGREYTIFDTFQDIVVTDEFGSPTNVVGSYMNSPGHCGNLMELLSTSIGSGTSNIKRDNDSNNTILFTLASSGTRAFPETCNMLANIDDPLYKPDTSQNLQVNLKTKKISTKNGKRLQINIDVDNLKAPNGDKNHDATIEAGTTVALQIKRKVGNTAFRTVLRNTFKVDQKGRAKTSVSVPSKSKWKAEVWYKLAKEKRFNAVAYAASAKK